jgi:large subunit ribosomal protein L3
MVEGLIGKKIGMTQTFDEVGNAVPVTVIKAGPCTVIQKKTKERDGYSAIQLTLVEETGRKRPVRPLTGHYAKSGIPPGKVLREFQFSEQAEVKEGDQFFVDIFQAGEKVDVLGTSKGKGFAGVVKRWGFHGGKDSHGSMFHRAPGSIGASAFPSRVVKGRRLPGHMGTQRVTVKNLTVIEADRENNLLLVKGAVPGAKGVYVLIKKTGFQPEAPLPKGVKLQPAKPEEPQPEPRPAETEKPQAKEPVSEESQPEQIEAEKPEEKKAETDKPGESKKEKAKPKQKEAKQDKTGETEKRSSEEKGSESTPPGPDTEEKKSKR